MSKLMKAMIAMLLTAAMLLGASQSILATIPTEEQITELEDEPDAGEGSSAPDEGDAQYHEEPYILGEDTSLREADEKHFRLSDGSYIAVMYAEPVHYRDGDEWADIDNTLTRDGEGYSNRANSFDVTFSADGESDEFYTLTSDGHRLKLSAARDREPGGEITPVTPPVEELSAGDNDNTDNEENIAGGAPDTVAP